jgi:ABC-type glycerol-3-phosphate transport system substrate-binding protein
MMPKIELFVILVILLAASAGCRSADVPTPAPTAPSKATATASPQAPSGSPAVTATVPPQVIKLTWWTPEFLSPRAPAPGGPLMQRFIEEFERENGERVLISPVVKARYGKGGLLDSLRSARPVAPGALPDIVALDAGELEHAVNLGLAQPLDELLESELLSTLYPFSLESGRFGGQILSVQFAADIEHLGYLRNRVGAIPSTWAELLQGNKQYLFPAGSPQPSAISGAQEDIQNSFISQYLSAGGTIDGATHQLVLEHQPLLRVLTFYSEGRAADLIPVNASTIGNVDDTWSAFVQGSVPMANVSARRLLVEYQGLRNIGFAPAPGWSAPAPAVTSGWVFAIVTPNPARQRAAAAFLAWLLAPERNGVWSAASAWLPVSSEAFAAWDRDPYIEFLDQQLATATAHPGGADYTQTAARIHRAVLAVLDEGSGPAEATRAAMLASK